MATIDRFVEIVAHGLSTHEAARAVKMSERSGDRYMSRPDIKPQRPGCWLVAECGKCDARIPACETPSQ